MNETITLEKITRDLQEDKTVLTALLRSNGNLLNFYLSKNKELCALLSSIPSSDELCTKLADSCYSRFSNVTGHVKEIIFKLTDLDSSYTNFLHSKNIISNTHDYLIAFSFFNNLDIEILIHVMNIIYIDTLIENKPYELYIQKIYDYITKRINDELCEVGSSSYVAYIDYNLVTFKFVVNLGNVTTSQLSYLDVLNKNNMFLTFRKTSII